MSVRATTGALLAVILLAGCTNDDNFELFGTPPDPDDAGGIEQSELASYEQDSPEYFTSIVGDRVFFMVDQSTITEEAAATLRQQADWLTANPDFTITVEGHADEQGTREYNLALGARRAGSVKDFLVGVGIAQHRISTVTYGKERPVAACSDESCWSQNRRSVTLVYRELSG